MTNLSNAKIIIVDDTEENIDLLVDVLEDDYKLNVAMDGTSALKRVAHSPPDLILLDIMMPDMDGYEVCAKLKANATTKEIPIIFITAMAEEQDETKGLSLGAVDYITKPIKPAIVKERVKNHLQLKFSKEELKIAKEELKKQNEILRENARLREDIQAIARHDIKTPLNAIITIPDLLKKQENITLQQKEILEMFEQAGYRVMDIINSTIDLYRMEKGKYDVNPMPVDILKVIRQLKGEIKEIMVNKEIEFKILIDGQKAKAEDTFTILGEEMLYYSMLANLIKNAAEASKMGLIRIIKYPYIPASIKRKKYYLLFYH
jgi:CheY-like chemotaxis protein